jgi:hypothetical protein
MLTNRPLFRVAASALVVALLPGVSSAQQAIGTVSVSQTDVMNARHVVLSDAHKSLVEIGPKRWGNSSSSFIEVKRTETEIYLAPADTGVNSIGPVLVDFASGQAYLGFDKAKPWDRITAVYPTSGYSMSRVEMLWDGAMVTLDLNGTDNRGWKLTTYSRIRTTGDFDRDYRVVSSSEIPASAVSRSFGHIKVKLAGDELAIFPAANTCTVSRTNCGISRVFPISGSEAGQIRYGTLDGNNQWVGLRSLTQVSATTWREEAANGAVDWTETSRNPRRIVLTRADKRATLAFDMSIGSQLRDSAGNATNFRVAHVQRRWPGQLGTQFQPVAPGQSPGFQIQNKTDYPVLVTLEQVGCLYYGIVKPGEVFQRNTGAVWFTIKASMAPDLKEPTVESCIRKPAMYAATIVIAGASAGTLAVPAMLATAAGQGAAIATQQYVLANNGTATGAMGARVGVSSLMQGPLFVGLVMASGGSVPSAVASVVSSFWPNLTINGAAVGATELYTRFTQQSDVNSLMGQLTQEASVFGAYAGYPWPWKAEDRVMPRYDITGGPRVKTLADGSTILLLQERPLTISKVN